jgi:uncharacterized membrane protein
MYFNIMLFPVVPALALAVWTNRGAIFRLRNRAQSEDCGSVLTHHERIAWKVAGIIGLVSLLIYLSNECYQYFDAMEPKLLAMKYKFLASTSLTIFWTLAALILTTLALRFKTKTLRMISVVILGFTALKIFGDLEFRPEFATPFFNPYSFPMFIFAAVLIAIVCLWIYRLPEDSIERRVYRFVAFSGVVFLWFTLSIECFRSVRLLTGTSDQAWQAQMALSILWSLFAGILIAVGFIWRSATLRWMAILLFAATLTKILIVDMSGVNELYRFGAVFALATLLALATWAYQRFDNQSRNVDR